MGGPANGMMLTVNLDRGLHQHKNVLGGTGIMVGSLIGSLSIIGLVNKHEEGVGRPTEF